MEIIDKVDANMNSNFAKETTKLMSEARLCAIDLGSTYISTIHLFLADCKTDNPQSIEEFVLKSSEAVQQFYESQRVSESGFFDSVTIDSLPITVEMEQTIRLALKLYGSAIRPCHLFLAASQLKESLFYSILQPKEELYKRLVSYYTEKGIVLENRAERKSFWQRFNPNLKAE